MTKPVREQVLQAAMDATLGSRNKSYGAPTPNLQLANNLIAAVHPFLKDKYSPAHNQAIYLALHKLARIACGAVGHTDNYVDAAAYFAIAAECQDVATPKGNFYTTGSDLAEEFWKSGNGFKDSLQSVINGDTEEMLEDIARQNHDAAEGKINEEDNVEIAYERPYVGMLVWDRVFSCHWKITSVSSDGKNVLAVCEKSKNEDIPVGKRLGFNVRSISPLDGSETIAANLRCLHCPADAVQNKDVCVKCAMELGQ